MRDAALLSIVVLLLSFVVASPVNVLGAPVDGPSGGPIVQQVSGGCYQCDGLSSVVPFQSSVAQGNLIVVGVSAFFGFGDPLIVSDTLGSHFTQVVNLCNSVSSDNCASIFYATAPNSGADSVNVTVTNGIAPISLDIFLYELSGVSTVGALSGTGQSFSDSINTTAIAFSGSTFLLGVVNACSRPIDFCESNGASFAPGPGFTESTPSSGSENGFAQYSYGGVSSPTMFPATLSTAEPWVEVSLVLGWNSGPSLSNVSLPPVIPENITVHFNTPNVASLTGYLVSLYGTGIVYNVPGFNASTDLFPYVRSVCYIPSGDLVRVSTFTIAGAIAGPGLNSTELFVSNYSSATTSAQGWPVEPVCTA